jgi:purine nucleosidase
VNAAVAASPVFADVDTGVDDALALVYLLASPNVELVGIASTGGNVAVHQVCANNLGLLELCRAPDIPVSRGVEQPLACPVRTAEHIHGPTGLGYAELPSSDRQLTSYDAAEAWVRAAHTHPGQLIGVATGPLTNLALALRAEPALPTLLRRLVIMGGAFDYRGNTTPVAEFNISVDPEAAAEVFAGWAPTAAGNQTTQESPPADTQGREPLPIVCGLDLTKRVAMTPEILAKLAAASGSTTTVMSPVDERGTRSAAPNPLVRVIEDAVRFYFERHLDRGWGYLAYQHDPLAAATALDPQLVATRTAAMDVELTGTLTRGMTVADWSAHWGREPNARIGIDVDPAVFFDRFIERVGPFARRLS